MFRSTISGRSSTNSRSIAASRGSCARRAPCLRRRRLDRLRELVRQNPEQTAPAMLLAIALRQAGLLDPSGDRGAEASRPIPRRIIQFWDSGEPPADMRKLMQSWRERHPDFDYQLFDDESAKSFIMRHFPIDVVSAFARARHPAQRADIFRLAYLERRRRVSMSMRTIAASDRSKSWRRPGTALMLYQENYGSIANDLIGATPEPSVRRARARHDQSGDESRGLRHVVAVDRPRSVTRAFAHCVAGLVPEIGDWRSGPWFTSSGTSQRTSAFTVRRATRPPTDIGAGRRFSRIAAAARRSVILARRRQSPRSVLFQRMAFSS